MLPLLLATATTSAGFFSSARPVSWRKSLWFLRWPASRQSDSQSPLCKVNHFLLTWLKWPVFIYKIAAFLMIYIYNAWCSWSDVCLDFRTIRDFLQHMVSLWRHSLHVMVWWYLECTPKGMFKKPWQKIESCFIAKSLHPLINRKFLECFVWGQKTPFLGETSPFLVGCKLRFKCVPQLLVVVYNMFMQFVFSCSPLLGEDDLEFQPWES